MKGGLLRMAQLNWGDSPTPERRVAFYPKNAPGYAWLGVTTIYPIDRIDNRRIFIDGVEHRHEMGGVDLAIAAVTFPDEFEQFNGFCNEEKPAFDLTFRVWQADGTYKLNLVYNVKAMQTVLVDPVNGRPMDEELFTWVCTTTPEVIPNARSSAHLSIDTASVSPNVVSTLEACLYGTDTIAPTMPTVRELFAIFFKG